MVVSIFPVRVGASNPWLEVGTLFQDVGRVMVEREWTNYDLSCYYGRPCPKACQALCNDVVNLDWSTHDNNGENPQRTLSESIELYTTKMNTFMVHGWRWVYCLVTYYHIIVLNIG